MAASTRALVPSMASTAPQPPAHIAHGLKRRADDALDDEQRFTKRFHLLDLNALRPIQPQASPATAPASSRISHQHHGDSTPQQVLSQSVTAPDTSGLYIPVDTRDASDAMSIDDTPHRVYIHDLDAELASLPTTSPVSSVSEAEQLVFLPDIERHLTAIPLHVLRGTTDTDDDARGKQLVLYADGAGRDGDRAHDVVRQAIRDTKRRAVEELRRRQKRERDADVIGLETAHGFDEAEYTNQLRANAEKDEVRIMHEAEIDADAMDMDMD